MKKGLIIINAFSTRGGQEYQADRLLQEFKALGVEIKVITNLLTAYIDCDKIKANIPDCDFVIYLDKDRHLAEMLELAGYKLFNSARSIYLCDDKMATYIALAGHDIAMPFTISSPLNYSPTGSFNELETQICSKLSFPIVVKQCFGSFGQQVSLINNVTELREIYARLKGLPHLYQQYIASSYGFDNRIIVIGGKVYASMLRRNENDFRSNLELGGVGSKIEPKQSFIDMAEKVASVLNLDYCGVDIMFDQNSQPILCEVNSNAFFKGIESVTGINVASGYAQHIYNKIYK
ncbi:MAG: RimK family alpha-L-glutamate ligase [Clostridia bacterium]